MGHRRESPHAKWARAVKRALDLSVALPACLILWPLFVLIAIAIKIDSPGPALFAQKRWGRNRVPFTMLKFRSLRHGEADPHERYEMLEQDSRITRVGTLIRRTSIDELPQLLNVVAGSMSLVGPRPLVDWESLEAEKTHAERYLVKPGITGWSQVTVRNAVDFHARLDKDVEYVRRQSLALDLWILLLTPWTVLRSGGIYPEAAEQRRA
jgi:lipopolysaccharide/colanic/teichoic acid biosynthesis glycosyltransferase